MKRSTHQNISRSLCRSVAMVSALVVLPALAADVTRPTLTISSPTAGQRIVTNAWFAVRGTAKDNVGVSSVWVQLNSNDWAQAAGTTNWNLAVSLAPGPNTVRAYSQDLAGNHSVTSTPVSCSFVVPGNLTVTTNGQGKATLAPTGPPEVGQKYTLTAVAATGFGFINWTDGDGHVVTNKPALTFTMASSLTFTVNFADNTRPTVTLSAPTAGQRILTNGPFAVRGTAKDNLGVSSVWVKVNSNDWAQASGTTNWNLAVVLTPGSNTVRAFSQDAAGNCSLTSTPVACTYVVLGNLTVVTNGLGKVVRTPAGPPEVAQKYTLTATAATGFGFVNWTDGDGHVVTNKPALTFTMASNLIFAANFVDNTRPTVTIAAPTAKQQIVTNGPFTVRGMATDNVRVSSVWVQVNSRDWAQATGTTNWNLAVALTPGSNTVRAFSQDAAGNCSPTSAPVACTYVVTALMTVQTTGNGTVATNYNGQQLRINQQYAMTATPAAGCIFVNWTNGANAVVTTNRTITFTMQSNLVLVANFLDVTRPAVSVQSPTAAQRIQGGSTAFTVTGSATDNVGVASVWCQLNGGGWIAAGSTNGFKFWTNAVTLAVGSNTILACSLDAAGNSSPTSRVACSYVVTGWMQVLTTGSGTIVTNYNNQQLEINQLYRMTATPAAGSAFVNWTDGADAVVTTGRTVTFVMQSNLVLTANFRSAASLVADGRAEVFSFFDESGDHALDPQMLASAATNFGLAALAAPANYTNRIYNAVVILLNLVSDPTLRSQAGAYGINLDNLLAPTLDFPTDGVPAADDSIDVFAAAVLPALNSAVTELSAVPSTWTGLLEVSPADCPMLDESVWVDIGDVTAMRSACKGLKAAIELFKAYDLNVDFYRLRDPVPTPAENVNVDGQTGDWAGVPVSLVNYGDGLATTQAVSVAMDGDRVALLVNGTLPFDDPDVTYFWLEFTLRPYGSNPFPTSTRTITVDVLGGGGQATGLLISSDDGINLSFGPGEFDAAVLGGVMEIKLPELDGIDAAAQITLDAVDDYAEMSLGGTSLDVSPPELWQPMTVPLTTLRANHPEFLSGVRDTNSLNRVSPDLQSSVTDYLAADMLIGSRSATNASLLHVVNIDPADAQAQADRTQARTNAVLLQTGLAGGAITLNVNTDIEPSGKQALYLANFFHAPYIFTNKLPAGLTGTLKHPIWTAFPDPTFNGMLPGMTNAKLDKYLRWDDLPAVALATMTGRVVQVQTDLGSSWTICLGTTTYSQSGDGWAQPGEVGSYTYATTATNAAMATLVFTCTAPPSSASSLVGQRTMTLTFTRHNSGTFVSDDGDVTGTFITDPQANVSPASVAGKNLLLDSLSYGPGLWVFSSSGFTQTGVGNVPLSGTYSYTSYGSAGALLVQTVGAAQNYVVLLFDGAGAGSTWSTYYETSGADPVLDQATFQMAAPLTVTSSGFSNGGAIPKTYAYDDGSDSTLLDYSPPLAWTAPPAGTQSFVLLGEDVDGSDQIGFAHWVVFNLPASVRSLTQNQGQGETLSNGATQGVNDYGDFGYDGPLPLSGETDHYSFQVFALDTTLTFAFSPVSLYDVQDAMRGHVLAIGALTGTYTGP